MLIEFGRRLAARDLVGLWLPTHLAHDGDRKDRRAEARKEDGVGSKEGRQPKSLQF